jgi:hypothetical protein
MIPPTPHSVRLQRPHYTLRSMMIGVAIIGALGGIVIRNRLLQAGAERELRPRFGPSRFKWRELKIIDRYG